MKITYFGHSAFQIETDGTTLLIDPFLTDNPHTDVSPDDLDPDFIIITHAHSDHFADAPSIAQRIGATVISNFEITQRLSNGHGHDNVHPLNEGGKIAFDWGTIEAVHARHTSSFADGSYGGVPNGHVMHIEDRCIYNAGDTAPFAEMEWIGDEHTVHLAVFPIGDVFTMGFKGALRAAEMVQPGSILPVHYDTFPPIQIDYEEWEQACSEAGFQTQSTRAGESFEL